MRATIDIWRYYDVIHTLHTYGNPLSEEAVLEMEEVLGFAFWVLRVPGGA